MKRRIEAVVVDCVRGDITRQPEFVAIVNAANAQLLPGGGVAGAIHRAAGPGLASEAVPLGPISPGEAVLTGAHDLPNRHVIHCLGPVYGRDEPSAELLAACYRNALELAEQNEIASLVFPAISTGAFGYPLEEAARVALETIAATAPGLTHVRHVRFALFGRGALEAHERVLARLTAEEGENMADT
ncbi:MAG: macro domain-containing protein [Gemmatimonadales bacterium]|jgi:O-acetyl-ADP-ribose deacetylase (regulator of RNase III)